MSNTQIFQQNFEILVIECVAGVLVCWDSLKAHPNMRDTILESEKT